MSDRPTYAPYIGTIQRVSVTQTRKVWRFPPDRFIEYGPEDERWARLLGFGREEEVEETLSMNAVLRDIRPVMNGNHLGWSLQFQPIGPVELVQ